MRGKPTPALIETTLRNLEDVRPNVFLNVPKGFRGAVLPLFSGKAGIPAGILQPPEVVLLRGRGAFATGMG